MTPSNAFVDPRLELAVRAAMPQEVLAQPMSSLTHLDASDLGIRRLGGVEQLSELRWLDLSKNPLTGVAELGANTRLIRLILRHTLMPSLAGLAGLEDLEDLDIYGSRVLDIGAVAALPSLRSLDLGLCIVKNLAPLAALTRLESLTLGNPTLHIPRRSVFAGFEPVALDLRALTRLASLRQLRMYGLALESLAMFEELVGLEELVLERSTFRDRLHQMPQLPRLEVLSLAGCEVPDLGVLARYPRLRVLYLDDAKLRDLRPLQACPSLEMLSLRDAELEDRRGLEELRKLPRLSILRVDNRLYGP